MGNSATLPHPVLENLKQLRRRIRAATERSGRDPESVEIIAVVKYAPIDAVQALLEEGSLTWYAESRVQDALKRRAALGKLAAGGHWRFIGHLQTNKAKNVLPEFERIDSIDSLKLAEALDKRLAQQGETRRILAQVKLTGKESQSGVSPETAAEFIEALKAFPRLELDGLMAIAPLTENPEDARPALRELRRIFDQFFPNGGTLSMGMSRDFEVAIEEGATAVRIGTALFGSRDLPRLGTPV